MKTLVFNIPDGKDIGNGIKQTATSAGRGVRNSTRNARAKLASWIAPKPPKKKVAKKVAKKRSSK